MQVQARHTAVSESSKARRRSYLRNPGTSAEAREVAVQPRKRASVTLAGTPGLDAVDELSLRNAIWWWSSHKLYRLAQSQGVDDCSPDGLKTALLNDATAW